MLETVLQPLIEWVTATIGGYGALCRVRADAPGEHGHPHTLRDDIALRRLPGFGGQDASIRGDRRRGVGHCGWLPYACFIDL
jgi:hypothetical protein